MTVEPQARLSAALADRYRIERELGAGGMATVWLAEDLKHDRKVAIKVLKPELAAVLGAERFVQEIKTTAQLQHPHILPLHDSGTADGFLYYVMPYVEGETLRDNLDRETQLGIDEAVRITREVADALDYAHRHGIIHRDIKPENILLHDGRPMVADFGIALAVSAAAGGRMTETGTSIGTPHYMSPEQATGDRQITGRADQYSLASVLYEMLAGEPPHTGSSAQAVIMKIIADRPRSVSDLRKSVPSNVAAAVMKGLEKLPADRFESAKAFADALADPTFTTTANSRAPAASGVLVRRPALTSGLVAVRAAAALWGWLRPGPAPAPTREHVVLQTFTGPNAIVLGSAIAPDGSAIVYGDTVGGTARLWIKERDELQPRPLASLAPSALAAPSFSPDGQWIVYTANGRLQKVGRQGGSPVQVSDSVVSIGAAWLDDGTIVFVGSGRQTLYSIPAGGGAARRVFRTSATILKVTAVPDARAVLVSAIAGPVSAFALDLGTDSVRPLGVDAAAAWVVRGTLLYATSAGELLAAPFDARHLTVHGAPTSILQGIRTWSGLPDATVGRDGTLHYLEGAATRAGEQVRITSVARDGGVDTTWAAGTSSGWDISLSPDGGRLALGIADSATGNSNLFAIDLATGIPTRLSFSGTQNFRPAWSPDGATILYVSNATGRIGLWTRRADGSGQAMPVELPESRPVFQGGWSPDRTWLVYRTDNGAEGNGDILAVRTSGDTTPVPLAATDAQEVSPAISPDGHWLAYSSDASGRPEIYVRPFPDPSGGMWQVSTDGGTEPRWSHSGQELFYRNADDDLVAVTISEVPTFTAGVHRVLFNAQRYMANPVSRAYDVMPDDKHFLFLQPLSEPQAAGGALVLMRNWLPAVGTGATGR